MSYLTALPLEWYPSGAAGVSLTPTGSAWTSGAWATIIPSAAADLIIAHLAIETPTLGAETEFEIDIGRGAAGSEAVVTTFRATGQTSAKCDFTLPLVIPIAGVVAGERVCARIRLSTTQADPWLVSVGYLAASGFGSTHYTSAPQKTLPAAATGTNVAMAGSPAWTNGAWAQMTTGFTDPTLVVGLCVAGLGSTEFEIDIGTGAAASEVVVTTIHGTGANTGFSWLLLPRPYKIASSTRVAVRLRQSSTSVGNIQVALLYHGDVEAATVTEPTGGGTVGAGTDPAAGVSLCTAAVPIAWVEIRPAGSSTVYRYAKVPINLDANPKTPRVATFGSIRRALSNNVGDFQGTSISTVLIDNDRVLRGLENSDSLIGARVAYYLSSEAAIRAGSTPRRVFDGIITDTEPLGGLEFRIDAQDYFGALMQEFAAKQTFPQRVFTLADFPNMGNSVGDLSNPGNPGMVGKPVPVGYGLLSSCPAVFVGRRTINSFNWDEYVVFGHAPSPGGILTISGDIGGERQLFTEDMFGVDVIAPGHEPSWTTHTGAATLYRDYNGNRYTTFFARGPRSDSAITGSVPFVVSVGGVESTGDGTGTMIDALMRQILHLLVNFVFGNYTSGAWLASPTVPGDLYSRINTASFEAVQTLTELYVAGGFKGSFLLGHEGEALTLTEFLSQAAVSGGFDYGVNKDGQLMASMVDPGAALNRAIVDVTDVMRQSFRARRRRDQLKNTIRYRYDRQYAAPITRATPAEGEGLPADPAIVTSGEWGTDQQEISDATSVAKYGARVLDLEMAMVADQATADAVAGLALATLKDGPTIAAFKERLCGTSTELGARDTLTHFEGVTATGYTARSLRCESHLLDLDELSKEDSQGEVEKEYRDLANLDYSALEI